MGRIFSSITIRQWTVLGVFNLMLVAALGLLMRSMVIFPQTWLNQKFILHAHSHFAFSGWISHMLMLFMAMVALRREPDACLPKRYQLLLGANMLASYGMLFCFSWQGYGRYSIIFSTLTILLSYVFVGMLWRTVGQAALSPLVRKWFRAALVFLVLSSVGTFYLAYLQATHNVDGDKQLSAVYFFLHFQYNGWFFFACMGLWHHWLASHKIEVSGGTILYRFFALTCVPAYLLSLLWMDLPVWLYVILGMAVVCQNVSWFYWVVGMVQGVKRGKGIQPVWLRSVLLCVLLAACLKLLLYVMALIPTFQQLTYSFRPIVIGYLHLVLLGIITLFILGFVFLNAVARETPLTKWALISFIVGIVGNESLLLLEGVTGMQGVYIPYIPLGLAVVALLLFLSIGLLWISIFLGRKNVEGAAG
ncbi:hypothetical protein [Sphingobacterium faecale]|uniref:Uncharacterized protein n=1 Tax=Sphingobacterium faecale TaxID=2803775 RepID=A0ABS1R1A9_9SPHI|nr:hypothetical protein [Sphingobacterium faecale]MBL1408085.1 hypothetical protein [Sphingobacterium faecale]